MQHRFIVVLPAIQYSQKMKLSFWILFFVFAFSVNCTSDEEDEVSDNEDIIENEDLPAHRFVQEEKVVKSGKSKGQKKYITSLVIPPYTFKRKVDKKVGNTALFTCNLCEKLGYRGVSASAVKTSEDNDGQCEYELTRIPKDHKCVPSSTTHLKKEFTKALYDEVAKNPLKSIGKIYEETRTRSTSQIENENEKLTFLQDIPSFRSVNPDLYRHRQSFIPKAPSSYDDFDISHEWFQFTSNESVVKGDVNVNGGRVILFTSKESLKLISRTEAIGLDGTFKISPKLWKQVFIVNAQVISDLWLPVAFAFLPDKQL